MGRAARGLVSIVTCSLSLWAVGSCCRNKCVWKLMCTIRGWVIHSFIKKTLGFMYMINSGYVHSASTLYMVTFREKHWLLSGRLHWLLLWYDNGKPGRDSTDPTARHIHCAYTSRPHWHLEFRYVAGFPGVSTRTLYMNPSVAKDDAMQKPDCMMMLSLAEAITGIWHT